MKTDYLIVGQGLAGSAMAMALLEKGASVMVLDKEQPNSATRVAAGLVTTLAGKGMNPAWRQEEYLPEAMVYYRDLEKRSGRVLFHEMELLKLFDDEKQCAKFERKKEQVSDWFGTANSDDLAQWNAPHGGFVMQQGGWLDTNAYMDVIREILGDQYRKEDVNFGELHITDEGIRYREIEAKAAILCQGAVGLTERGGFFADLPHRSAKGEMLRVRIPDQPEDKIISSNGWLVPTGNQIYKAGATYEWEDMAGNTSAEGREQVERKVSAMLGKDAFEVLDHSAGVRPILRKSQPLVGSHRDHPQIKFFNGLGSKGVITAPSVARHFAEHLVDDVALDPELDIGDLV